MSGRQVERGRSRGRGQVGSDLRGRGRGHEGAGYGGRGRGGQHQVPSHDGYSRGRGRGGQGDRGVGGSDQLGGVGKNIYSRGSGASIQPDMNVQKIEDNTVRVEPGKSTSLAPGDTESQTKIPQRPGYGTQGRAVILWANYFEMIAPMDLILFRYSIEIRGDESGRKPTGRKARRIVELLIEEYFPPYKYGIATDYKSNLISRTELPIEVDGYRVQYKAEGEDDPALGSKTYIVYLKATGAFLLSELMDYLTSSRASALFGSKEEIIQALNIVTGHYPKTASQIFSVGSSKHFPLTQSPSEQMSLGAGLQAVRGFFISVRSATSRLLFNIQVKHTACYEEGPLGRLMLTYLGQNGDDKSKLNNFLKKIRVRVTHIVRRNKAGHEISRTKAITNLAIPGDGNTLPHPPKVPRFAAGSKEVEFFLNKPGAQLSSKPQSSLPRKGAKDKNPIKQGPAIASPGHYISVYDFFKSTYNITVQNPQLPVINVGNRQNPSYLPADVCQVEPGQASKAKLSPSQTQQMIRFAVRKPAQNAQSIVVDGARLVGIEPPINDTLSNFELAISSQLITVPGRVLMGPSVKYKNNIVASTAFGSWNMRNVKFSAESRLPSWTYLMVSAENYRDPWNNEAQLHSTLDLFQAKLLELGVGAASYDPGLRITVNPANIDTQVDEAIHRFATTKKRAPPKLVFVILPRDDSAIYNRVKFACDVKEGLLNVCAIGSKLAKPNNDQYFANVALKFNLKLGGRNQFLDNAKLGIIAQGKTMVVGIDVTHPSPGSAPNAPSVAGIVASVDQWLGQWPADLGVQAARQEMVSGLDGLLKSRLRLWAKINKGIFPENILIYRDGVSEGQYDIVLDQELPLLRKACQETYPAIDSKKGLPHITIIIVGKRHNTRFYPTREEDADRSSNPQNGTVVDRGVTEARHWDFFLQAHTALQGTARPAHYFIIIDEIFRQRKAPFPFQSAADTLEDLTHNMCYLFGRATKAVSICPPAYYADLVCERARCYLSKVFDASQGGTPGGSIYGEEGSGKGGGGGVPDADPNLVRIHENVKDSMFYI